MHRRLLSIGLVLALLAAAVWLFWGDLEESGILPILDSAGDSGSPVPPSARGDRELEADLTRRARLRGLPGVRTSLRGIGRLTGTIHRHVAGAGGLPLPGVRVRIVGAGERGGMHEETTTIEDGTFAFPKLPAHVGYAVIVDHPPYKEIVLRGTCVERDRTTDLGVILLGAPTLLRGDVVDGAGRPLPAAQVQVLPDRGGPRRFDWRRGLFELQSALACLTESRTGSDGSFVLRDLSPGRYVLRVSSPGYATVFRENVWVTADERAPSVRVVLDPGAGYEGRVLDEVGGGIRDARVIAVAMMSGRSRRLDRVETRSDAQGRYRLDVLVAGDRYFVEAWGEGFAPAGRILQPKGMEELDFVLSSSGRVEGRITDAGSGIGIEGAEVTLVAGNVNTLSPVSAVTEAGGRYVLPHVSAGPIVLFAAKADGYPAGSFDLGKAGGRKIVAGETTVIDWALTPGFIAVGRVTDEKGTGIAYATVAFAHRRHRGEGEETALTLADGSYRVEGIRAGPYEVAVSAPGFAPLTTDEETRLEVPENANEFRHDFVLVRGAVLQGTVFTPDGGPASGARLEAKATAGRRVRDRVRDLVAVTAPTGRWRIAGVPPGVPVVVEADHDDWVATASDPIHLAPSEEREIELRLQSGVRLAGRVADSRGTSLTGARVRWGPVGGTDERRLRDAFRADQLLTPRVVRTGGDGRFLLDRLPTGRLIVKVERDGYADWYRKDIVLSAEVQRPDLVVEMSAAEVVRGTIRDALTKLPIPEAWVYAREEKPGEEDAADEGRVRALVSTQTGNDGRYELEGLPPDREVEVVVWLALGYVAETQDRRDPSVRRAGVRTGATGIDFSLRREGAIEPDDD